MSRRILEAFARWFASAAGVWQTTILITFIVLLEIAYPHADEHGFWLLFWATIFSTVTQPALAYVGAQAGIKTDTILNEELQLIKKELRRITEAMT